MGERIKGKTLIASDEGDVVNGVTIKLYGEETNGAISIIEQPFEPMLIVYDVLHPRILHRGQCLTAPGRHRRWAARPDRLFELAPTTGGARVRSSPASRRTRRPATR